MKRLLYTLFLAIASLSIFADARLDSLCYYAFLDEDWNKATEYVKQGANVNITPANNQGVTILHNCAMYGYVKGVKWCIENNADLNAKDIHGATPLHYAVLAQQTTICKMLVENGADTRSQAANEVTPINFAELVDNPRLAKYLENPRKNKIPTDFNEIRLKVILSKKNNDFKQAIKDLQAGIKEANRTLPPSNKFYSLLWADLANAYYLIGENDKAQEVIDEGFSRVKKHAYGTEIYYRMLAEKCSYWLEKKNIEEAADSLLICLKHVDSFSDFESKYVVLCGLGAAALEWNLYDSAIDYYFEAISYAESLMLFHKQAYEDLYYTAMLALSGVLETKGNAEELDHAILVMSHIDEAFKNRHDYLSALYAVRKGHLYFTQGNYYKAEEWYQRAEKDWYSSRGTRHIVYATILYYLAEINSALYEFETAISLYSASIRYHIKNNSIYTIECALGQVGLSKAMLLSNIIDATNYSYIEIDDYLYSAINKINKIKGYQNLEMTSAMNVLCQSLYVQKNDTLVDYYTVPILLMKKLVPQDNILYLRLLLDQHSYATQLNDTAVAYSSIVEYDSVAKKNLLDYFLILPEEQRSWFWSRNDYGVAFENVIPGYIYKNIQERPTLSEFAYDNALFRKGILLNTAKVITNSINSSNDTVLINLYYQLIEDKRRYNQLSAVVSATTEESLLNSLNDSINSFEQYVTRKCRAYVDYKDLGNLSWHEVEKCLKDKQTAVEIVRFDYSKSEDSINSTYYVAIIITKDSDIPQYVYLFEESELVPLINSSNKDNIYDYSRNGRQLSEMIWSKLIPYIGDAKTIYFSPDGLLCQLAVEALPISEDSVYSDAYNIVRCSSTKYLLQQHKESQPTSVDLFGGIQYDMTPDEMLAQSSTYAMHDAYRGEMPDSISRGHYGYLKGAKQEVDIIAQLLNKSNIEGRLYTGNDASEEAFKAISGSHPNVLHIATHGFFWPQEEAERKDYFMASFMADNKASHYVSSMERAGLLFAGANVAMTGHRDELPSNVEDGVLSAQEISTMDLYGTDLVVLSACETGQGDLESDGVYGLQRAFKLAGVQTIIMSLWKVNDAATQMLMTEFYSKWIVNKMSKRKAFEAAKQKVRAKYPEPSCWAGFIMLD